MLVATLMVKHPDYNRERWEDYWALYAGGHTFRERVRNFLKRNPNETKEVYDARCGESVYRSYIGAVIDYFCAMLFGSGKLEMIPKDKQGKPRPIPVLCQEFLNDVDGAGTDLIDLARQFFVELMTRGGGAICVDFPGLHTNEVPTTQAEFEALGWNKLKVRVRNRPDILDWEYDDKGNLEWLVVYEEKIPRRSWDTLRNTREHVWTIYDREYVREFTVVKKRNEPLMPNVDVATLTGEYRHNLGFVPAVFCQTNHQLWIADKLESAQIEHFRLSSAQNWGIRRSCFTMPVIYADGELPKQTMGSGYMLNLPQEAKMEWLAPEVQYMEYTQREIKSQKDEIYRAIGQMSLSMDNTAIVVGRSAESKMADAESVRTLLNAYGAMERNLMEEVMRMFALASGEMDLNGGEGTVVDWTAAGLDRAAATDPLALVGALLQAMELGVPSDKFWALSFQKLAFSAVPEATYEEREQIRTEIDKEVAEWRARQTELQDLALDTEAATAHSLGYKTYGETGTKGKLREHGREARARVGGDPGASLSAPQGA